MSGAGVSRWSGEVSDYEPVFSRLRRSLLLKGEGGTFKVPARSDYATAFRGAGLLSEDADLGDFPHLVAAAQAHWHAQGCNACTFASRLSVRRVLNGWETYVVNLSDPHTVAKAIDATWQRRLPAPEAQIVSFILAEDASPAFLAALLTRLGELQGWVLTDQGSEKLAPEARVQRLGLRAAVGAGHWSEILGFGPITTFGFTRRAPFAELAIRAEAPREREEDRRAFMAQAAVDGQPASTHPSWYAQTGTARAARLAAEHDKRAKARVTFALPFDAVHSGR